MKFPVEPFELPPDKRESLRRAKRLEWVTIFFLLSIIAAVGLTMGASQTMKAMWTEDLLSLVPPVAFLYGARYLGVPPDDRFPYGYRRAMMIAFLCAAVALFGFGLYIFADSVAKLIMAEHPTIQTVEIFGRRVWLGWLMIAALVYSAVPPFVLGRMKLPLARELHLKALQTDAAVNKGDWLSGLAGVLGLVGIAYGYWWADSVAAGVISFEILRDGFGDLKNSVAQLMNKRPSDVESKEKDPTVDEVQKALERLDWVREARVRLREDGDVLTGEAFVVPRDERDLLKRLEEANDAAHEVDWRLHDINIVPVESLEEGKGGKTRAAGA
ncbi:MAG TPA: cation transporter [Pyrinomonadaceae bacterium]|nr:cation transporter [Pyrinomonadaceae bacterium]